MIPAQRAVRPSKAEEKRAYELCTYRDRVCVRCGSNRGTQRDHRRNRSQGGVTAVWQLQLLCSACHAWKTSHPAQAVADGFAVPASIHSPREYPARRLVFGELRWVLYAETGFAVLSDVVAEQIRTDLGVI